MGFADKIRTVTDSADEIRIVTNSYGIQGSMRMGFTYHRRVRKCVCDWGINEKHVCGQKFPGAHYCFLANKCTILTKNCISVFKLFQTVPTFGNGVARTLKKLHTSKGDYVSFQDSVGAKLRYMGYFASLLHPLEEKVGYYFQSGTCLGASETHVLLSFLWSTFYKWPIINVTPQTLKIAVHKIQD